MLAAGPEGVQGIGGFTEYFNLFYDYVEVSPRARNHSIWRSNSALSCLEVEAVANLLALVDAASAATPSYMSDVDFIKSGWPEKIQPVAAKALALLRERGRFSEDVEEVEPGRST